MHRLTTPLQTSVQLIIKARAAYEYSLERLNHLLCDKIQVVPVNRGSDMVQVCLYLCLKYHYTTTSSYSL